MARKLLRKYVPAREWVVQHRALRWLAPLLQHHNLWHLNRRSVAGGVAIGLFAGLATVANGVIGQGLRVPVFLLGLWALVSVLGGTAATARIRRGEAGAQALTVPIVAVTANAFHTFGASFRYRFLNDEDVDLHPTAFAPGHVAATTVSHLAVQLWQTDTAPVYRLLGVRSYFESLWHWLAASSAEFGAQVLPPARYAAPG